MCVYVCMCESHNWCGLAGLLWQCYDSKGLFMLTSKFFSSTCSLPSTFVSYRWSDNRTGIEDNISPSLSGVHVHTQYNCVTYKSILLGTASAAGQVLQYTLPDMYERIDVFFDLLSIAMFFEQNDNIFSFFLFRTVFIFFAFFSFPQKFSPHAYILLLFIHHVL